MRREPVREFADPSPSYCSAATARLTVCDFQDKINNINILYGCDAILT
jgi:hypothetical protein